jgi:ABC-2 type transport system permease protein
VAAIGTFVVLAGLNFIGTVWQNVDFFRDITYYISIARRTKLLMEGLISSRNIFYFVIVIATIIQLAIMRLRLKRTSASLTYKAVNYISLTVIVILVGYLSFLPSLTAYYDATATRVNTLTPASRNILKNFEEPVQIHTYVNVLDEIAPGLPQVYNQDKEFFEWYERYLPNGLQIDYTYYYDSTTNEAIYTSHPGLSNMEIAKVVTRANGLDFNKVLSTAEFKKIADLTSEQNRYIRELEYNGRKTFLRQYYDMFRFPFEEQLSAAMKRLLEIRPVVAFLSGHDERSPVKNGERDYKKMFTERTHRDALMNSGFDVIEINADSATIPANLCALVIADPLLNLNPSEIQKINKYLDNGGNLMVTGEPERLSKVNPLLMNLGVQLKSGTLLQQNDEFEQTLITPCVTKSAARRSKQFSRLFSDSSLITMPGATAIAYDSSSKYKAEPLLMSYKNTWRNAKGITLDSGKVSFNSARGDEKELMPLALTLTRKVNNKEQRIVVFGDADFLSNEEILKWRNDLESHNSSLKDEVFRWLSYDQFPIDTWRPLSADNRMTITRHSLPVIKTIFQFMIPAIILVAGAVLLIRRRQQ